MFRFYPKILIPRSHFITSEPLVYSKKCMTKDQKEIIQRKRECLKKSTLKTKNLLKRTPWIDKKIVYQLPTTLSPKDNIINTTRFWFIHLIITLKGNNCTRSWNIRTNTKRRFLNTKISLYHLALSCAANKFIENLKISNS